MLSLMNAADREAVTDRLHRLTPDAPNKWGRMTAHEAVCHMSDQLRVGLGDLTTSGQPGLVTRTLGKWIVLHLPLPIPRGRIETVPEMQTARPATWGADLAACTELIRRVGGGQASGTHPAFGPTTPAEWGVLAYKHLDHHLQQFGV
ncbi:MAG: DUF1569 domain-containing protein [Gemmatimonadales bacterium]|nr:DUF1569 domain-containing protein [Gemmatimonadales bacterium]